MPRFKIKPHRIFAVLMSTLVATLVVAGVAYSATTVGNDITVGSGLRIGTGSTGNDVTALANDTLFVEGQSEFDGNAYFDGAVDLDSTLNVAGASTLSGDITFDATTPTVSISDTETLTINDGTNTLMTLADGGTAGNLTVTGTITANGDTFSGDGATTYDAGGAAAITIGSADVTAVTIQTDDTGDGTDLVLPAQGVGTSEILNDTITFANISDSSAIDTSTTFTAADTIALTLQPTHTSGDTNFLTIDANQTDDAAATDDFDALRLDLTSESGDAGDTFDGIVVNWEDGTANTIMDSALKIDNAEATASTMTDAIIVTSSGVADGVVDALDVSAGNITNALNAGPNFVVFDDGTNETIRIAELADTVLTIEDGSGNNLMTVTDGGTTGNVNVTGATTLDGNVTLGDGSGDTITLSAGDSFIPQNATNSGAQFSVVNTMARTDTTHKTMGTVPANADIVDAHVITTTAFNGTGADTIDCGTDNGGAGTNSNLISSADVSATGVDRLNAVGGTGDIGVSDLGVECMYTDANSDSAAGAATVIIDYIID